MHASLCSVWKVHSVFGIFLQIKSVRMDSNANPKIVNLIFSIMLYYNGKPYHRKIYII